MHQPSSKISFYFFTIIIILGTTKNLSSTNDVPEFNELVNKSNEFEKNICTIPTTNNTIQTIAGNDHSKQRKIVEHAKNSYPLIHPDVISFYGKFLDYKQHYGTNVEKRIYQDMDIPTFIIRLIEKRPLYFMGAHDAYILRNGKTQDADFCKDNREFLSIGKETEKTPFVLADYLSYDEMACSSLLSMSSPTFFINNGNRDNCGEIKKKEPHELEGVYVGSVGTRFEKKGLMAWQHMIITPQQNTENNGYGECDQGLLSLWSQLYGIKFPTYTQRKNQNTNRYHILPKNWQRNVEEIFDKTVYKKHMELVLQPFLLEANKRGLDNKQQAYVHVVGIGFGVWAVDSKEQGQCVIDTYLQIIKENDLSNISDIDFSWFPEENEAPQKISDKNNHVIAIHLSKRNPADKLVENNSGKLLVAHYAWDSNAYPGNEYWGHNLKCYDNGPLWNTLSTSGDPAAACCSTIPQLQNILINFYIAQNIKEKYTQKPIAEEASITTEAKNTQTKIENTSKKNWLMYLLSFKLNRLLKGCLCIPFIILIYYFYL